jgi:hypothetical protein
METVSVKPFRAALEHTVTHFPQSMQRPSLIIAIPLRTRIASVGQTRMHLKHPVHLFLSTMME